MWRKIPSPWISYFVVMRMLHPHALFPCSVLQTYNILKTVSRGQGPRALVQVKQPNFHSKKKIFGTVQHCNIVYISFQYQNFKKSSYRIKFHCFCVFQTYSSPFWRVYPLTIIIFFFNYQILLQRIQQLFSRGDIFLSSK